VRRVGARGLNLRAGLGLSGSSRPIADLLVRLGPGVRLFKDWRRWTGGLPGGEEADGVAFPSLAAEAWGFLPPRDADGFAFGGMGWDYGVVESAMQLCHRSGRRIEQKKKA
jgi:hypothetical protein